MICLELEKPFLRCCSSAKLSLTSGGQKSASLWGFSDFWMTCSTCSELLCSHQRIHLSQLFSNVREQRCCQVPWSISMPFRLLQIINCNKERKVFEAQKGDWDRRQHDVFFRLPNNIADVPIQVLFFWVFWRQKLNVYVHTLSFSMSANVHYEYRTSNWNSATWYLRRTVKVSTPWTFCPALARDAWAARWAELLWGALHLKVPDRWNLRKIQTSRIPVPLEELQSWAQTKNYKKQH